MKKSYQIILGVIVVIVALVLGIHALNWVDNDGGSNWFWWLR